MIDKLVISWEQDLGSPESPTTIRVPGVGEVEVRQDDIDAAKKLGGPLRVEINNVTGFGTRMPRYIIGMFLPG